jgi:hypothetical protein
MPPITVVFVGTGLAVWLNGLYFLGIGSNKEEGGSNPLVAVGWVTLAAGLLDLVEAFYIITLGEGAILLAGIVTFYGLFFTLLGATEIRGLDLRQVGNFAVPVAIVPLFWWSFFSGSWMFQSILIVWLVAFLAITATTYGKLKGQILGAILVATAVYTFWLPVIILALGNEIP